MDPDREEDAPNERQHASLGGGRHGVNDTPADHADLQEADGGDSVTVSGSVQPPDGGRLGRGVDREDGPTSENVFDDNSAVGFQ